jgi:hypothetical protein
LGVPLGGGGSSTGRSTRRKKALRRAARVSAAQETRKKIVEFGVFARLRHEGKVNMVKKAKGWARKGDECPQ